MKQLSFIAAAAAFAPIVEAEQDKALSISEDNPRLDGLGKLGNLIARCLADAPAQSLPDLAAKSVVMKIQLPSGREAGTLWMDACEQERLSWSMAEDAVRLAGAAEPDPAIEACRAYWEALKAVDDFTGGDDSEASHALSETWRVAAASCYRTKPKTAEGVRALFDVMLSWEDGCLPDDETKVLVSTLCVAFAEALR